MAQAKKSLGQHFLTSPGAVQNMVRAGKVSPRDTVLEIGPGKGVLTKALLSSAGYVVAVEKDRELIPFLEEQFKNEILNKKLTLLHEDIRNLDIQKTLPKTYKVVANIPYYITGELFEHFLSHTHQPTTLVFLVQKEVAERIARSKKESLLSISVKVYGEPHYVTTVKAGSFTPKPNVDSAILAIENISRVFFNTTNEQAFFKILKAGFAHKRKLLTRNLAQLCTAENIVYAFKACDLSENARAEELSKEQWGCLTRQTS